VLLPAAAFPLPDFLAIGAGWLVFLQVQSQLIRVINA
jgi:hypothetical protein